MASLPPPNRAFRFDRILIGDRWERDVRIEPDADGRIVSVEPRAGPEGCERVAGWTIPGVPNVHSHAFQRGLAGLAETGGPSSFWRWREVMYAFVERLTPDDVEAIAAQLYVEMLKSGFTCVGEFHYLHHAPGGAPYDDPAEMSRRIAAAARLSGIGLVHMPVCYEVAGFGREPLQGAQRRFAMDLDGAARLCEAVGGCPPGSRIRTGLALHSLRAVRSETLARLEEFLPGQAGAVGGGAVGAAMPAAPVHIHVAEQEREVRECVARRGARPVEWLLDHAPVDGRWCLVHATRASDSEAEGMARAGAVVGLCPTTEANLGDGLFRLGPFAARGGRFAVGTDSHVSRSPVEELRLLEYGQRLASRSRSVLGRPAGGESACGGAGGQLLAHAWRDGCRALAWNGGRVERGARADLVALDAEHPSLVGRDARQVLDSWIFSGTDSPVRDVMVGGDWVVRDGRHVREEEVRRAFANALGRLSRRLLPGRR